MEVSHYFIRKELIVRKNNCLPQEFHAMKLLKDLDCLYSMLVIVNNQILYSSCPYERKAIHPSVQPSNSSLISSFGSYHGMEGRTGKLEIIQDSLFHKNGGIFPGHYDNPLMVRWNRETVPGNWGCPININLPL